MHKQKAAFTLLELVVVIVILAIFTAAFAPMMANMMASARDTRRIADCTGYITAIEEFYTENGFVPGGHNDPSGGTFVGKIPEEEDFTEALGPFTKGVFARDPRGNTDVFYYHYNPRADNFINNNDEFDLAVVHVQTLEIKPSNTDPALGNFSNRGALNGGAGDLGDADYVLAVQDPANL